VTYCAAAVGGLRCYTASLLKVLKRKGASSSKWVTPRWRLSSGRFGTSTCPHVLMTCCQAVRCIVQRRVCVKY
jgi:hypothetical protein